MRRDYDVVKHILLSPLVWLWISCSLLSEVCCVRHFQAEGKRRSMKQEQAFLFVQTERYESQETMQRYTHVLALLTHISCIFNPKYARSPCMQTSLPALTCTNKHTWEDLILFSGGAYTSYTYVMLCNTNMWLFRSDSHHLTWRSISLTFSLFLL
jgi:hypothetical protein